MRAGTSSSRTRGSTIILIALHRVPLLLKNVRGRAETFPFCPGYYPGAQLGSASFRFYVNSPLPATSRHSFEPCTQDSCMRVCAFSSQ